MPASVLTLTLVEGATVLVEHGSIRLLLDPSFEADDHAAIGHVDAILLTRTPRLPMPGPCRRVYIPKSTGKPWDGHVFGIGPLETCAVEGREGDRLLITGVPMRAVSQDLGHADDDLIGFALGVRKPGDLLCLGGDALWYAGTTEVAKLLGPKAFAFFADTNVRDDDVVELTDAFTRAMFAVARNERRDERTTQRDGIHQAFERFAPERALRTLEKARAVRLEFR